MQQLRGNYADALEALRAEEAATTSCVELLQELMDVHRKGFRRAVEMEEFIGIKRKVAASKAGDQRRRELQTWEGQGPPPPLCGRVKWPARQPLEVGNMVAAKPDEARDWILATTNRCLGRGSAYEIEDADVSQADSDMIRETCVVPASSVIPLPNVVPKVFTTAVEFARDARVLALYPPTTALYPSVVVAPPSQTGTDMYELRFDGESEAKSVSWRFVVEEPH